MIEIPGTLSDLESLRVWATLEPAPQKISQRNKQRNRNEGKERERDPGQTCVSILKTTEYPKSIQHTQSTKTIFGNIDITMKY